MNIPALTSPALDDSALVELAQSGSHEAFAQLVLRHQAAVRGFIGRLTKNADATDDLAQETFLAAFRNVASHRSEHEFLPWVKGIARNKAMSHLRQRVRDRKQESAQWLALLAETRWKRAANELNFATDDWLPRLRTCLDQLAPHSRALVNQYYFDGQSAESLAGAQSRGASAVRMALLRIRTALGKCLRRHESRRSES